MTELAIIVLAAGKGTRMKSTLPKVMHRAAGRSLLGHVLHVAKNLKAARVVVIAGPDMPEIEVEARAIIPQSVTAIQNDRKGTGHAVSMAQEALAGFAGKVLVLYGDVPLLKTSTAAQLVANSAPLSVLGFRPVVPTGYGRLIQNAKGAVVDIREELDATPAERKIGLCNSGIIAIDAKLLWKLIPKLRDDNAKKELYLTDLVGLTIAEGLAVGLEECPAAEVAGVNDRAQLAGIEADLQQRYRAHHMANGATLTAPETVFFSADTKIGQDVVVGPHVGFGPGVSVADNVEIHAFSHIEGATILSGARIGPFARLRPGAEIGEDAHIGNFVEIKKSVIGKGAKANHLSYIGDARVGARSNIGAGTITCNYDGYGKHLTEIGAEVFVGSNTALVAPVVVGDGANIAAGSVITRDVPADALAITRAEQQVKEGWAAKYREIKKARKAAKAKGRG